MTQRKTMTTMTEMKVKQNKTVFAAITATVIIIIITTTLTSIAFVAADTDFVAFGR